VLVAKSADLHRQTDFRVSDRRTALELRSQPMKFMESLKRGQPRESKRILEKQRLICAAFVRGSFDFRYHNSQTSEHSSGLPVQLIV
jgi:hypothetical protein